MRRRGYFFTVLAVAVLGFLWILGGMGYAHVLDPNVILEAKKATVGILSESERTRFRGTGFHIGDGYIVTARHIAETEADTKTVLERVRILTQDQREMPAFLSGDHAFTDVAVYRVGPGAALKLPGAVSLATSDPKPGEEVFTVGYPLDWGATGPTVTFGRVGTDATFLPTVGSTLLQLDLPVCSGNSGSGLFNTTGEVVGIVHAIIQTEYVQGWGGCSRIAFAIPGYVANRVVQDLREIRQPRFARLGVAMDTVKLKDRWRVRVTKVEGPASEAGLKEGDIILSINQKEIYSAVELKTFLLAEAEPNQNILLRVLRRNEELVLGVVLGEIGGG
ncbi:MAG: trypsin-like peptidase domain-containing protein [Nitrospirae bacterium]|nr:trypsin-like peptidase domain-containing protein [Nitrospirota bacterium]